MKKYIFCQSKKLIAISVILLSTKGYSQNNHLNMSDMLQPQVAIVGQGQNLFISSSGKNPILNNKNSSYFMAEWLKGIVLFKNGKRFDSDNLQFDLAKNELHFKNNENVNGFVDPIKEFLLFDTAANSTEAADFRNGYPDDGLQNENSYYQVISSGSSFQLLKYWSRREKDAYVYGGPYTQTFANVEDWYIYDVKNKILKSITLKASSIGDALSYNSKALKQFESIKKGKRLAPNEVIALIDNINTL